MTDSTSRATTLTRIREADDPDNQPHGRNRESVTDPASMTGMIEKVRGAWRKAHPYEDGEEDWWIQDVYDTYVIAEMGGETYRADYSISPAGAVTFGDPSKVAATVTYTPAGDTTDTSEAGTDATGDTTDGPQGEPERLHEAAVCEDALLESVDEGGWVWRMTMIRPGTSHNRRRYRPEVLAEAAHLYEGAKAFDGHRTDEARRSSPIGNMVGWWENVAAAADGSLQGDFHISESAGHIRTLFQSAWKAGRADLIGVSHDASAFTSQITEGGRTVQDVRKIAKVHSVDLVAEPSAGGRMERLVAGGEHDNQGETTVDPREFLRRLRAGELTAAQIAEAIAANPALKAVHEAFEGDLEDGSTRTPEAGTDATGGDTGERITETRLDDPVMKRLVFGQLISEAKLPDAAAERLRSEYDNINTVQAMESRIAETRSMWEALQAAQPAQLSGQHAGVQVTEAEAEKFRKALDGMIAGRKVDDVPAFRSLKEAYGTMTGDRGVAYGDTEDYNRRVFAGMIGAVSTPEARITESLDTSSWAQALGDSIRRSLIAEYSLPAYNTWRQIVSSIVPRNDFRTNRLVRLGGYDVLPVVSEGAPYQALTSPTDEEATYAITKKGGTEDYTLEMVANDDLGALRRIPSNLGRAAALTLYRAIWVDVIAGNPTIYDGNNLFDASNHSNTATSAGLAEATIGARRQAMVQQKRLGEDSGYIGVMPRFLVVPSDLYVTGFKLTQSRVAVVSGENGTTPNPWEGLVPIEVPVFTDANDWFLVADPNTCPTIEVGFYQGREDPELFVQDQPTIGSVFTADKFTWKIRHIWGLTVEDYRGFQRGQG